MNRFSSSNFLRYLKANLRLESIVDLGQVRQEIAQGPAFCEIMNPFQQSFFIGVVGKLFITSFAKKKTNWFLLHHLENGFAKST